jgi:cobalt-zinc-cadmium efflux system outer membrane protein
LASLTSRRTRRLGCLPPFERTIVPDYSILRTSLRLLLLLVSGTSIAAAQRPNTQPSNEGPTLTVERVIAAAVATHPRLGAAREMVNAARGTRLTARSWTNPFFSVETEESDAASAGGTAVTARETMTTATLPLEPIYQLRSRSGRASAELRATEADLRSARNDIAVRAATVYYEAALAQVRVDGLEEVQTWLDSLVAYTRARVREGAAAEVDFIRLQVEQDRAGTDLAFALVDRARSRADLALLIGTDSFRIDPAVGATAFPSGTPAVSTLETLTAIARVHRPEIAAARERVAAAGFGVSVERNAVIREVGVMAGVKNMAGTRSLMAGLSLPLPIFDQNRGEIQRAEAQRRIATFDREIVERQVVAEVRAAYTAAATLNAQASKIDGVMLRRAEESRRIAEGAYREGATSLTQVLDAARALVEARETYYRALFARNKSLIDLNAAIGSDNVTATPAATSSFDGSTTVDDGRPTAHGGIR